MKKIYLLTLIIFFVLNLFAQDSTIAFFNKNIISGGLGIDYKIPMKSRFGSIYYFNMSPLANIDYSVIISNNRNDAIGFDLNVEFGNRMFDEQHYGEFESSFGNFIPDVQYYHNRKTDIGLTMGLNYYRRISSKGFIFYNLSILLGEYEFSGSTLEYITVPSTGKNYTYYYDDGVGRGGIFLLSGNGVAFNYKMGCILPFRHFNVIPFIETPILTMNFSPFGTTWFNKYGYTSINNYIPFLEISFGCNIVF